MWFIFKCAETKIFRDKFYSDIFPLQETLKEKVNVRLGKYFYVSFTLFLRNSFMKRIKSIFIIHLHSKNNKEMFGNLRPRLKSHPF